MDHKFSRSYQISMNLSDSLDWTVKLVIILHFLDRNFHFVFLSSCIKILIIESRMILEG